MIKQWMYGAFFLIGLGAHAHRVAAQGGTSGEVASGTSDTDDPRVAQELLSRPVTITVVNATRKQALRALAAATHVPVQYQANLLDQYQDSVTIRATRVPMRDVLAQILAGTSLRAVPDGPTQLVVVDRSELARQTATGVIRGVVIDSATEHRVARVTVTVQGTPLATTTDAQGGFVLRDVPAGDRILVFKLLGYYPVRRPVVLTEHDTVALRIVLSSMPTVLSGVVTTATGVQSRRDVASDITSINADSVMRTAPIRSVTDLLDGRVPGMTVIRTTGTPGDPARLRLRGAGSIEGSNDPIVIVDGVRVYYTGNNTNSATVPGGVGLTYPRPSPLDQIDPNTIERIDVLKGPSASALYGSDAANGVIVIVTKHGQPGSTHWGVGADAGTSWIPGSYPAYSFAFGHELIGGGNSPGMPCILGRELGSFVPCIVDTTVAFQALNDPRYSPLTHGVDQGISGSVSGGAQNFTYSMTGSARGTGGLVKLPSAVLQQYQLFDSAAPPSWMLHPDQYQILSGAGQVSATLSPTLNVSVMTQVSTSQQNRSSLSLGGVGQLIGLYVDTTRLTFSPLMTNFSEQVTGSTNTSLNEVQAGWQARSWLSMNANAGVSTSANEDVRFTPSGLPLHLVTAYSDTSGEYSIAHGNNSIFSANLSGVITVPLPGNRSLQLSTGFNGQNTSGRSSYIQTVGLPRGVTDPTDFPNLFFGQTQVGQAASTSATYGWYLEPTFNLSQRFIISPGIRLDGGSNSGANASITKFPKTSVVWIVTDAGESGGHPFAGVLDALKLRGTYGYAGVLPPPASRLRLVGKNGVTLDGGNTSVGDAYPTTMGNTHLRPERSVELETGFDADLIGQRLLLGVTYYHKKRLDAILNVPVASSAGGSIAGLGSVQENIGTILNHGLELTVQATPVAMPMLHWNLIFQSSQNFNKLLSFYGTSNSPGGAFSRLVVGYPIDGIWVQSLTGYADANHDGVIESNEVVLSDSATYAGTQNPTHTSALSTNFSFWHDRISLSSMFTYDAGITQYDAVGLTALASAATQPNATLAQQANYVATIAIMGRELTTPATLYQPVNVWRWTSASLGWTLPAAFARALHAQSGSLSLQGSNLWLRTNYRGKDPDVNSYSSGEGVADIGQIPQPRVWSLSVRLSN